MPNSPDTLIPIADAPGHAAAHAMASALRDAGIAAFVFDTAKTTLQWEAPLVIAPYKVHVRQGDADEARLVLADNRQDSVDIDWNEIDVGDPEDATSARIASEIKAPWMESGGDPGRRRPIRDAAFRLTGIGLVLWIFGALAVAIATAILIVL
ncbi:MAG: hypothetical protein AAFR96_12170 [Planctomycetota bacterium]